MFLRTEYIIFIVDVLAVKNNGMLNLEIEEDSKMVIDNYNKKSNIPSFIMLLMENIWKITQDVNVFICHHIYKEANRITNCFIKKKYL